MKKLRIDETLFDMAFERDTDFHDVYPQNVYLDCDTGNILWVFMSDDDADFDGTPPEENRAKRLAVEAEPQRYIEISGRSHGEHHDILREFLVSDWKEDEGKKAFAQGAYTGSIGRWKEAMEDAGEYEIVYAWHEFKDEALKRERVDFLRERGIEPIWV